MHTAYWLLRKETIRESVFTLCRVQNCTATCRVEARRARGLWVRMRPCVPVRVPVAGAGDR